MYSYYPLTRAFSSTTGNIAELVDMHKKLWTVCKDPTLLLTFASNHDTTRLAALAPSLALRKNALAYTLLSDGIPEVYQGDEQGFSGKNSDPDNREAVWLSGFDKSAPLYLMIQKLNKLRTWAGRNDSHYWASTTSIFWSDSHTLAMRKGSNESQIVAVLTNRANDNSITKGASVTNTGFGAGTILMDVIACEKIVVGRDGGLSVEMADGNPKVFFPLDRLSQSRICDPWLSRTGRPRLPKRALR
jgi:alpha-amylase